MATCRSCHEEIKWGKGFGGKWIAFEPEPLPGGEFAFWPNDPEKVMQLPVRWRSFEDIPASLAAGIPEDMREWWAALLEQPRHRVHSLECQYQVATSLGYTAEKVLG